MYNVYAQRIADLRSVMRGRGWDAVILTGADPHSSEFPALRWKQVEWLTGFTGESGDVVVTMDHAGLWTDGRYFIQAVRQLEGSGVELHRTLVPDEVPVPRWLASHFAGGERIVVAVDGLCFSVERGAELEGFVMESVPDLLDTVWVARPGIPQTPVTMVDPGEDRASKIAWLRTCISSAGCDACLLTALDEIAWMLNVRAADIEYNPFVISYLMVTATEVRWFVLKDDVEDPDTVETFRTLGGEGISIEPYNEASMALGEYDGKVMADPSTLNFEMAAALSGGGMNGGSMVYAPSPVQARKAVKNAVEIAGMRQAHLLDGVAVERFLYWLEKSLDADRRVTEWDAAVKLGQYRSEIDGYEGDSFETISAYGPGAAQPHYITPCEKAPELHQEGLYLCDSGAQYVFGTTDVTRTIPLGVCTELEKEDYTLALKGHIDLAMAVFPAGTPGCRLDALAREPIWQGRRNFTHGTGHGVGYYLGVHEGPQSIRQNFNPAPIEPGMVTSDEPGIYREGMHGIRHENLLLCVEDEANEFGRWLRFEPLTLCHFDTSAIVPEILGTAEIRWLDDYNRSVYEALAPYLPGEVAEWLKSKTAPLAR